MSTVPNKFMIYHNHRSEPYFTFLKNGQKTIEGRVRKGKYCKIKPGDEIIVYNEKETDSIKTLVIRVDRYQSIREMLKNKSIKKILPNTNSIGQAIKVYRKLYTPEQEKHFGMVAIEIEVKL